MIIALLVACLLVKNSVIRIKKRCGRNSKIDKDIQNRDLNSQEVKKLILKRFILPDFGIMSKKSTSDLSSNDETDANDSAKTILTFKDSDEATCLNISGKNVHIIGCAGNHTHGSSKVKLKTVVDYKWEPKHYPGHLIAAHMRGDFVAYVIVNNKANRMEGMVRVLQLSSSSRVLIKGMSGEILDIQFAYIWEEVILATIDANSLYVHRIYYDSNLKSTLVLQIEDPLQNYTPAFDKICWCHFLPRDDDIVEPDEKHLIIWARGSRFQGFYIKPIVIEYGEGKISPADITIGYRLFEDTSTVIRWLTISPDGTTVCICSKDGYIRFYQLYMFDKEWRCLHLWKPHDGKPISSCFFLDNLNENFPDMKYWKYAITGANNNTELKLWDCGTWTCLQTITISMENEKFNSNLRFIAEMDSTSEYLVISSLETKSCYVLQVENSSDMIPIKDLKEGSKPVSIKSIAEFPLSSGILSFAIRDAAVRRYKCGNDTFLYEELFDFDDENTVFCVVVRLLLVQSKSVQECSILYQPNMLESNEVRSPLSESPNINYKEKLDTSNNTTNFEDSSSDKNEQSTDDVLKKDQDNVLNRMQVLFGISSNTNNIVNDTTEAHNANSNSNKTSFLKTGSTPLINNTESLDSINASPKTATPSNSNSGSTKNPNQVNLLTPDSFTAKSTPDSAVSSDVLNTILMLANATKQQPTTNPALKPDNNLFDMLNNKLKEDQESKKVLISDPVDPQKKFVAIDHNPICDNLTSGGSSPSREVQEIMSLQEFEKSGSSSCEDEDVIGEQAFKTDDVLDVNEDEISGSKTPPSSKGTTATIRSNWSSELNVLTSKHSSELQNAVNLIPQTVASTINNHCAMTIGSANPGNTNPLVNGNADKSDITDKLDQILDLMTKQNAAISALQKDVDELKKINVNTPAPTTPNKAFSEFSFKLELQITKLIEQYMKRMELEQNKRFVNLLGNRETQCRELRDTLKQTLEQFLHHKMSGIVGNIINVELQRTCLMINGKIDQVHQQIQMDIAQKVNHFDLILKENIAQACKNKSIIDAFGKSVLVGVQNSLQSAFIESMSSTLIPAYEKSSQNMFQQLHEAFSSGMKEFMEQFDTYVQQMRPIRTENNEGLLNSFNSSLRQNLDTILGTHRVGLTEGLIEIRKDVQSLDVTLTRNVQDIRAEIRKGFDIQVAAIRSQANTPAPLYDARETIKHLLAQGQINKAFHQALLANDLNLVEYTLKTADHSSVFTPECVLEQKVLLSLMQQISADMSNHHELKQNYLTDALLAINLSEPIVKEHAPKILNEVYRNCQLFLLQHPKNPQCSNVRMLVKAIQSFNKENF